MQIHFVELPKVEQFTGKLAELAQIIDKASPELETAQILKSLNVPPKKIQKATGLSFEEIQKL